MTSDTRRVRQGAPGTECQTCFRGIGYWNAPDEGPCQCPVDGTWALNELGHIGRIRYRAKGLYIGDRVDGSEWKAETFRRIEDKDIAILLQEHKIHQNPTNYTD